MSVRYSMYFSSWHEVINASQSQYVVMTQTCHHQYIYPHCPLCALVLTAQSVMPQGQHNLALPCLDVKARSVCAYMCFVF